MLQNLIQYIPKQADWLSILVETSLVVAASFLLLLAVLMPKGAKSFLPALSVVMMLACIVLAIWISPSETSFSGMLGANLSFQVFVITCGVFSSFMAFRFFAKDASLARVEFFAVLMLAMAALSIFVRSANLMLSFVSLEGATICFYILTSWNRKKAASLEAGVRFLIISGISGTIFLMGIALVYGAGLKNGLDFISFKNFSYGVDSALFCLGMVFVFSALLFKVGAFPFQFWMSDVYQGAPTPVTAFFAVASKAAGVIVMATIVSKVSLPLENISLPISIVAAATILVGNIAAISQANVKRLMALSGIANAGYLLVLLASISVFSFDESRMELCFVALYFYLVAYMFATYGVFYVLNMFANSDDSALDTTDYCGLSKICRVSANTLAINLSSLAGIPPTAGFFAKVLVLVLAWSAGLYWLVGVMILGSAISIYYYFAWMRTVYVDEKSAQTPYESAPAHLTTLVAISAATLCFGIIYIVNII